MKKVCLILALAFLLSAFLPACSPALAEPEEKKTETAEKKNEVPAKKTETEEEKEEKKEIMQEYDPKEDDRVYLLMIGSSSSYYYVEELHGVAKAAGIDMTVCNLYYSGCKLSQHWTWWKQGESNYQFFVTDESGRKKYDNYSLVRALQYENWDMISIQERGSTFFGHKSEEEEATAKKAAYRYMTDLMGYIREQFPLSSYYWHHTWAYQVGYDRNGFAIDTVEKQTLMWSNGKEKYHVPIAKDFDLIRVPSADAWQYARQDARVGDVLCDRGKKSDNYHDGEEGGGQYLNACVWFETLTGQNCLGNTWRPDTYSLSEEKIVALQQAAHRAVAESRI